ncbi:hypothetical protein MNBD_GAMMA15-1104 [hydrothermal vent metagenome]|uniref:Histidine kinase/HSP90-like ATPase domain-containing protein n=1 Tax=hydrothermal vent metagenome TaxID=652676 RepID=A0A3B0Y247_9ZZZZ
MVGGKQRRRFSFTATIFVLLVAAGITTIAVKYYCYATSPPTDVIVLQQMLFYPGKSAKPPPVDAIGWTRVTLPQNWRDAGITEKQGWYAMDLEFKVPPNRLWGMYLPRVTSNVLAYINGEAIGRGGRFRRPVARNSNRPLYFSIPNGFLQSGSNRITLRVKAATGMTGYLGSVYLGPDELVRPVFQRLFRLRVNVVEVITASLVLVAVLMLGLWSVRRKDSLMLWFSMICLIWALHNLNLLVVEIPVSVRSWESLRYLSVGWFSVLLVMFMHRFLGLRYPVLEILVYAVALIGSIVMFSISDIGDFFRFTNQVWIPGALLLGVYPAIRVALAWWKSGDTEYFVVMFTGLPILPVSIHDWLHLNGYIQRDHGLLMQYSAATMLLGFTVMLLMRYAHALNASEQLTNTLEARVEEKGRQLEANYQQMQKLEHDRVLSDERERIMRDMHDGVGGHLVSALAMTESKTLEAGKFKNMLGNALMDLRLMIDSLDQTEGDLTSVLGVLRSRLQPALEESGITVQWQVADIPVIADLGPSRILQIMRILQEAITNVLKHAGARVLTISTGRTGDSVFIEIRDNGAGIRPPETRGHGLRNMHYRASRANIGLKIEAADPGTRVCITVPLGSVDPQ